MSRILFILFVILAAGISGYAQKSAGPVKSAKVSADVLQLNEESFDFGAIPQGRPVTHNFVLTNNGKAPLLLNIVEASCGCTTPEWNEAPVQSGATSTIKVGFNAASEGQFRKTINITYNNNQVKTLVISGNVYPTPTTSAPLNPSLSVLKQTNQ
jgi:hypothetical protein